VLLDGGELNELPRWVIKSIHEATPRTAFAVTSMEDFKLKATRTSHTILLLVTLSILGGAGTFPGGSAVAQETEEGEQQGKAAEDERFHMLNVLWFKPEGGAEKYNEYLQAAGPFVLKHGGKSEGRYVPEANLIGEFDADLVFFVEWPSQQAFLEFIQDPGYQAVSHLRKEAIRDSLLIRCKKQ